MRMPGTIAGRRIDEQVSLVDLAPTIRDSRRHRARDRARAGVRLRRCGAGETLPHRPAFVEGQDVRVVRAGGWAYLRRSDGRLTLDGGKRVVRTEELYDLSHDAARA